ncbi:MAG: KpsF/GutQ family protein [Planctomycetes bacterium RBG_16_64_10]|nr:MAG: KpsF/GutQ family protein [Planctomycetes bacterium RBG_16_64_10]
MTSSATRPLTPFEQLRYAREILTLEAQALLHLAGRVGGDFCRAVRLVLDCRGSLIVTGMGKAGLVGQKIAATLASTGTRSHFLHPAEAIHGDLGRICHDDVLLILSQSGETEEIARLLPSLAQFGVAIIAITGQQTSTLGRAATVTVPLGSVKEACALGLAPSASTTAMLALGDALALVVSRMRNFQVEDFARFHPGGSLGRKLSKVQDHMRPRADCRVASDTDSVRHVVVSCTKPGRRSGAIMLTDASGRLSGIFTDSDLARLFENHRDHALDGPIRDVMTCNPCVVPVGTMLSDAVRCMAERKISELPVVDSRGAPIGLIDITDIVGLPPEEPAQTASYRNTA